MLEVVIEFVIEILIEISIYVVLLWLGLCRFFITVEQVTLK